MMAMRGTTGTSWLSQLWTTSTYQCNFGFGTITCLQQ